MTKRTSVDVKKRPPPDAWLARRLQGGPVPFLDLITEWCAEARVSVSTGRKALGRAKDRLSVESTIAGYPAAAVWALPHWVTAPAPPAAALAPAPTPAVKPASPAAPRPTAPTAPQAAPQTASPTAPRAASPKLGDGGPVAVATVALTPRGLHTQHGPGAGVASSPASAVASLPARVPPPAQRIAVPPPPPAQRVPPPPPPEPEPELISDRAHWLSRYFRLPPHIVDFGELSHGLATAECIFCEATSAFHWGTIPVCPTCARATAAGRPPRTRAEADRIRALGGGLIGGGEFQTGRW